MSISQEASESQEWISLSESADSDKNEEPLDQVDLILPTIDDLPKSNPWVDTWDVLIDTDEASAARMIQENPTVALTGANNNTTWAWDFATQSNTVGAASDLEQYVPYNSLLMRSALWANKKVIIFFYAPWDPASVWLDTSISSEQDLLPKDVMIFRADYDNQSLRQNYTVQKQRTLLLLNNDWEELRRSNNILAVDQIEDFVWE